MKDSIVFEFIFIFIHGRLSWIYKLDCFIVVAGLINKAQVGCCLKGLFDQD